MQGLARAWCIQALNHGFYTGKFRDSTEYFNHETITRRVVHNQANGNS